MDIKPRPHHKQYISTLRSMSADRRLRKAFELSELGKQLLAEGMRRRHPDLPDSEIRRLYLQQLAKCHNRNY